ncbi:MAG TPA: hypothetical protein VGD65_05925 [Chryseosolibacter sp.]
MNYFLIVIAALLVAVEGRGQQILAPGQQPQLTVDSKGKIRLVYGESDKIYFSTSNDNGKTFSSPQLVAQVSEMHLGMTRGPQLATSVDYSLITAMDKKGNIHAFRQSHKTGKWERIANGNSVEGSAPEGLMSIGADEDNNFYAVWLDLREGKNNNICFASLNGSVWSTNKFVYKSPDEHVCECCKPSISASGNTVAIMFRNWLRGSRDLYLITSIDGGQNFSDAQKLGNGTWPLKGCPMDGGGLSIDSKNQIQTAWQRDGVVFYCRPGQPEQRMGDGRHVGLNGSIVTWETGSDLMMKPIDVTQQKLGEGTAVRVFEMKDKSILAVWEKDGKIVFKNIKAKAF